MESGAKTIQDLKTAVFSSMDLPPLFPYFTIDDGLFEDGGVVDNLPLRFATELKSCDFLFVLPLNATFNEKVKQQFPHPAVVSSNGYEARRARAKCI